MLPSAFFMIDPGHVPVSGLMIRRAQRDDLDGLLAIESEFRTDRISRRQLRTHMGSPRAQFLVATGDGVPLGYSLVLFRSGSHVARLYSLAVASSGRGRGIGRALLERALYEAGGHGAREVRLEVRPSNTQAIGLYRSLGFLTFGSYPAYYGDGEAAVRMRLVLDRSLWNRDKQ